MSERADYFPESIRERLIHDPRVAEQDLRVEIHDSRVMLAGNVASREIQEMITAVARELLPDHEILNETTVVPCTEPEGEEPIA